MANAKRKRCVRYNIPNHAHELTFSCYCGRPFLCKERTCLFLAEAIMRAREKYNFGLWAYVFMPNHVHILLKPNRHDYSIASILKSIKQPVARKVLIHLRKENPRALHLLFTGQKHSPHRFWQDGGGYDRNVADMEALCEMAAYIHNNPVRKGLVQSPEEWKWSSARDWLKGEQGIIPIDYRTR